MAKPTTSTKPAGKPTKAPPKLPTKAPAKAPTQAPTKPKPARTGALAAPVQVELTVDKALKKKWQQALEVLQGAKREGAGAFDRQWEAIGAIIEHDPPLYLAGGMATIKAFLETHVGENERTARRLIRVAKYASPAEENRYGISKLDAAISFIEAQLGQPVQGRLPVAFDALRIPVEKDAKTTTLPLEKCPVEQIQAATRALLRTKDKAPAKASPVVKAITKELQSTKWRGVTVRLAGGKVSFGGVPVDAFEDFVKSLARVRLPIQEG
ncbi:MAG: hypothetical protein IPK82_42895 [Polyangiaceae bacterium]|nr:hypothetical protein [Polyangiaceae bacterium]